VSDQVRIAWTTDPMTPLAAWAQDAGLETSVVILPGVDTLKMSKGQTVTVDTMAAHCPVQDHILSLVKFWPMYVQDARKAPIIQYVDRAL